jgi:hypothetical protein
MIPVVIDSFLKLGYFIDFDKDPCPVDFSGIDKQTYLSVPDNELVDIGIAKIRETFSAIFLSNRDNVVPISGGLDSRAILAALCELTPARNIQTYTYGVAGTYDFEIGCRVAKEAGTRHVAFPLNNMSYHLDDVLEVARRERCQAVLFHSPPLRELDRLFGGAVFWSGYIGDAIAGSHVKEQPSSSIEEAKRRYLGDRTFVRSEKLHRSDDESFLPYMKGGQLDPRDLTWDEQVLFFDIVPKFTAQHALFEGFEWRTPFINSPWADFMLSVPNDHRIGEKLFIKIARKAFPKLFGLPSKNSLGLGFGAPEALLTAVRYLNKGRKLIHQFFPIVQYPYIMYNDFNEGIRNASDLRKIVRESIADLRKRDIVNWIDFDGIWRRHDLRVRNHGDALIVLASLEIILKAREKAEGERKQG